MKYVERWKSGTPEKLSMLPVKCLIRTFTTSQPVTQYSLMICILFHVKHILSF
jgi:hypothetical protein